MIKFLVLCWILMGSAFAAHRIVILTSLNESKLENKISRYIERNLQAFEVELKHKATQDELYQAILSGPDGLIWVSHGSAYQMEMGIGATPQILDYQKNDIAPLFQVLKPQTQFLSIISCFAEAALKFNEIKTDSLNGSSFPSGKVIGMKGFRRAVKNLKQTTFKSVYASPIATHGGLIITRDSGNKVSLKVFYKKKFLGLVQGKDSSFNFSEMAGSLRLEYPKHLHSPSENEWGKINLQLNGQELHIFADRAGKAFGTYSRVFIK
jgi:hypothetical protein